MGSQEFGLDEPVVARIAAESGPVTESEAARLRQEHAAVTGELAAVLAAVFIAGMGALFGLYGPTGIAAAAVGGILGSSLESVLGSVGVTRRLGHMALNLGNTLVGALAANPAMEIDELRDMLERCGDLATDPGETTDLAPGDVTLRLRMEAMVDSVLAASGLAGADLGAVADLFGLTGTDVVDGIDLVAALDDVIDDAGAGGQRGQPREDRQETSHCSPS